jgi:hypothetical protein
VEIKLVASYLNYLGQLVQLAIKRLRQIEAHLLSDY